MVFASPRKSVVTMPCSPFIPEARLTTEEPQLVHQASDTLVPTMPDLLRPRTFRRIIPTVNIKSIRCIGPGSDVVAPCTGLAAGEGDKFPRGGLCAVEATRIQKNLSASQAHMLVSVSGRFCRRRQYCSDHGLPIPAAQCESRKP